MTKTYTLEKIGQAVEIGTTLTRSWYRGQSRAFNALTPGIFRGIFEHEFYRTCLPETEFSIIETFKRQAPSLAPSLPAIDDYVSWLFLMQHHGTPTRLLDWTKSVLVALYFAVSEHHSEDGELWTLYPEALNKHNGHFALPTPRCGVLKYLAAEPFHSNPGKLAEELKIGQIPQYPLAIDPPLHFPRMVTQMSTFTLHPRPKPGNTIPEIMTEEKHLVRYIIPSQCKKGLTSDLAALGITKVTLFPNLDSLSHDIVEQHKVIAYGPPTPPRWKEGD